MTAASPSELSSSYRIPKDEVPVEIALPGGEPETFSVFVSPRAAYHPGRERPSDLLFNEDPFLALKSSNGSMRFINKSAISWMTVAPELELSGRCDNEVAFARSQCRPIDIQLDDGRLFIGEVSLLLPDASSRLQDFLNSAAKFFEVRSERAVHFVNRDRVVMARDTE